MVTDDPALNSGQKRKIHIVEKAFGPEWRQSYPGMALDAVYNLAVHDDRKSLFCKIDRDRKARLAEMLDHYDTTMGDFIETMIDDYWAQYLAQRQHVVAEIADDYSAAFRGDDNPSDRYM